MLDLADTIVAIAAPPGGGARGIVRMSGPGAVQCAAKVFQVSGERDLSNARRPTRFPGMLRLGSPLGDVPAALYLWPDERSYTRQPSAEIHLPGSPPLVQAALAAVCRRGARLATAGEFTLRAFLAGRLDLTQAEAVLGVIDAQDRRELDVALSQLAGGLSAPLHELRNQLLDLLAHLEAGLDFVEEDIEFISQADLLAQLHASHAALGLLLTQMRDRDAAADAFRVVLTGPPNAGKSSLLNALAGEDAALVSSIAGTTRDYVTRAVTIDGLRCLLIDTAGLAGAIDSADALAETQAQKLVNDAHVVLECADATTIFVARLAENFIVVLTKQDLLQRATPKAHGIYTSALTGFGLDPLRQRIAECLRAQLPESGQVVATTVARCRDSLHSAAAALERAIAVATLHQGEELIAAELRVSLDELGRVAGAVYTDDILDRIFSRFCIGK